MNDHLKNILIAIFVIIAFSIIVFVLMFLNPSVGDENTHLKVRFANIDKITVGTRVTYGGKPVGEVISIKEIPENIDHRNPLAGVVYVYELDLAVDSGLKVFNTDDVSAKTSGLLGEKSVAITPMPSGGNQPIRLVNDEVIYATETGSVEETFKEFKELSHKIELALDGAIDLFSRIEDEKIVENLGATMTHIRDIAASLNNQKAWSETLANLHSVSEMVRNGDGSLGRLLTRDDFYLHVISLLNKGEVLMNDINHYGLLFHSNKQWQRLRARRLNLLQTLSTPQEFRNYFNDEVDQISTSLERLTMLMEQTSYEYPCSTLYENQDFTKVFAELMRRISVLEEEIRMYNTQVVESAVRMTEFEYEYCQ